MSRGLSAPAGFCLALVLGGTAASVKFTQDAIPADGSDSIGAWSAEDVHHHDRSDSTACAVLPAVLTTHGEPLPAPEAFDRPLGLAAGPGFPAASRGPPEA